jgi:AcrR family transcriptional regulator
VKRRRRKKRMLQEMDDRVERSKSVVLATTFELLTKSGLSGVSVDEVSRRSGVAKTTIYRHWPSRESLLLDACSQLTTNPPVPDTGKVKTDLEALACGAVALLQQPWAAVMPSIIDAAERDKDLARLQSQIHAQTRGAFVTAIAHHSNQCLCGHSRFCLSPEFPAKPLSTICQLPESPYAAPDVTGDTMTWRGDSRTA